MPGILEKAGGGEISVAISVKNLEDIGLDLKLCDSIFVTPTLMFRSGALG